MKNILDDYEGFNSGVTDIMRQNNTPLMDELRRIEDMQKLCPTNDYITSSMDKMNLAATIGLNSPAMEEIKRLEEIRKSFDVSDCMKTSMDKVNLASTIGMTSPMMEEIKRMKEIRNSVCIPDNMQATINSLNLVSNVGITFPFVEDFKHMEELKKTFTAHELFPKLPEYKSADISLIRTVVDPMHKVRKIFEKSERNQAEISGHLKELVSQAKGTSEQNVKMIKLSTASLIACIVGIVLSTLVGILSYYAGKSSSVPNLPPVAVIKAPPVAAVKASPVVKPVPATVPASIK